MIPEQYKASELDSIGIDSVADPNSVGYKFVPTETWQPYDFQLPALEAFDKWKPTNKFFLDRETGVRHRKYEHIGAKRLAFEWHRQCGKDEIVQIMLFRAMLFTPGGYFFYMFPSMAQFEAVMLDNPERMWELVPEGFFRSYHSTKHLFTAFNGARLRCGAADNIKGGKGGKGGGRVGATLDGGAISEFQNCMGDPFGYLEPSLRKKNGFMIFNGTPRGYDQFTGTVDLYTKRYKQGDKRFYGATITNKETRLLSLSDLQEKFVEAAARHGPDIAAALLRQEYYCSREAGEAFAYFRTEMEEITSERTVDLFELGYPNPKYPIHTGWDLAQGTGNDRAVGVAFQVIPSHKHKKNIIYVIDYAASRFVNSEILIQQWLWPKYYQKGYKKGYVYMPWDIRWAKQVIWNIQQVLTQRFGLPVVMIDKGSKIQRIEATRRMLGDCIFNACCDVSHDGTDQSLMNGLRRFRGEWNDDKKKLIPYHDWTSDFADAFGTGIQGIGETYSPEVKPLQQLPDSQRGKAWGIEGSETVRFFPTLAESIGKQNEQYDYAPI